MQRTIRELREAAYLTQAELGELVGVSHVTVSKWEHGKGVPRARHVRKLAEVFGVPPQDIALPTPKSPAAPDTAS